MTDGPQKPKGTTMADYTITVKSESVSPDPLKVYGHSKTIEWKAGPGVTNFEISGLNPSQFGSTGSGGYVTSFTVTDLDTVLGEFYYEVSTKVGTVLASRIEKHGWDPRIENEGDGTDPPTSRGPS